MTFRRGGYSIGSESKAYDSSRENPQEALVNYEYERDSKELSSLLSSKIEEYSRSFDPNERELLQVYLQILNALKTPQGKRNAVEEYRKGFIPGLAPKNAPQKSYITGIKQQPKMPPAWS